ncbi:putative MFS family arabinose efflux permease [Rudaeicoccus suwonensis]|uniref:Putative MFS family arabinose efflux permease n=1 Tax=Rudaeicoccus suwonensis TaxID=657409 RepID=A0A561E960_9MICO|nr:putative MFS family arabinose efflux permease [Rudaeicoccus suwonensis]
MDDDGNVHWKRNLVVCLCGSFTTIVAMTMLVPFLPIFVQELGVHDRDGVLAWSGAAYSATFLTAALTAPLWGTLGDRYGRKSMLIRASFGMAIAMSCIGLVQNVWQLLGMRLLVGLLGGYSSGSTILVAAQTPRDRSAWALGTLSAGVLAGNIAGPLIGGFAPELVGVRTTFLLAGALIFVAFLATTFLLKEDRKPLQGSQSRKDRLWSRLDNPGQVGLLLGTASLLMFATMSVEPTITLFVEQLAGTARHASMGAGIVMSLGALGSIVSAPRLGRLADRVGHGRVIIGCLLVAGVCLLAQAAAPNVPALAVLRLLMGAALGGLLPAITAAIRHRAPSDVVGRLLGWSVSAQYVGQVSGPLIGAAVGARFGLRSVFVATGAILLAVGVVNLFSAQRNPL